MDGTRSRTAALEFLDYVLQKGLMAKNTAVARRTTADKVLAILDEDEARDVTALDIDQVMTRFQNLHGKDYTPESIGTYKSRVKSALDDFASYVDNPLSWRPRKSAPAAAPRPAKPPESRKPVQSADVTPPSQPPAGPMANSILPIPIRQNLTVLIQGLPYDLTAAEAKKIAGVIQALAESA